MPLKKPFYVTDQGGSIHCMQGLSGRIFRACSANHCTYTGDLHSAKSFLDFIENKSVKFLPSTIKNNEIPFQRKTTLKWNSDGSLSSVDMAMILSRLEKKNLTECKLSCEWGTTSNKEN
ncbi:hypothetical protein [Prochlorococcus sp. MIT 0916]|uniref:hypothetical protein n=1 Tax=Prochlorococcus sp. MIT 0916 TaxID=3082521 RepID=UPI0039B5AC45